MSQDIRVKKGLNIKLKGQAAMTTAAVSRSDFYAIKPTDFHGIIPKLAVKAGDEVIVGDVVFFSKGNDRIKFTSPVSGTVKEIKRGAKRKVLAVIIESKPEDQFKDFGAADPLKLEKEAVLEKILESGSFAYVKQRPYDIVANPSDTPKAIFVSSFDTNPLGPNYAFALKGKEEAFQAGINALSKLTEGAVNLSVDANEASFFSKVENATVFNVTGKHPAGNVGTQIAAINPINQGERVWTVSAQGVATIGELFLTGNYNPTKLVALAGSEVKNPQYYALAAGQSIKSLVEQSADVKGSRIISGNVLTGTQIQLDDYLGFYDNVITVIPEGNKHRFMGWLPFVGSGSIHSAAKTSFAWLNPNKEYVLDTSLNGEERALVVTGEMEKVVPLDIFPLQLLKACIANDIEKMENLGIYEVAPEDFALVDYTNTSKIEAQEIIRQGLDLMIKEVG
ncbi:NADH:ubiquinone reductase (Na(+)-transporting) subunit A [Wenyingzhuangia fucanilytica]|uniref:Na(+)-translocating NADH-quinone reductase subunit A n=1 Tax=Wenyingzhuangia fucanilytica TaxID=1790137 RepID=A0A1B1Y861_9FLAO|nr:Na(+)-translocating NADH-quinone reductase subunit A [Wenyingzhuangia fucanilytica]ANW96960.1 NADH:ubiquinone reductase (Na(+)-transporting) subunit A [Wenyingzhuangia fucanilytica]